MGMGGLWGWGFGEPHISESMHAGSAETGGSTCILKVRIGFCVDLLDDWILFNETSFFLKIGWKCVAVKCISKQD